MIAKWCKL